MAEDQDKPTQDEKDAAEARDRSKATDGSAYIAESAITDEDSLDEGAVDTTERDALGG